jgi:membrane protein DedA with SNARE-associated domain
VRLHGSGASKDGVYFFVRCLDYGPWIIFGVVAFESAGVPLPGETILVAAALLSATTAQIAIVIVVLAAQQVRLSGTVWDIWSGVGLVCPFFADTAGTSASMRIDC